MKKIKKNNEAKMGMTFDNLVDEIQKLNNEQKEELKFLLEKYLIEEQREEFYQNFMEAKKEVKEDKLKFTSNISELKRSLDE